MLNQEAVLRLHAQVKATLRKSELSHSRFDLTKVSFTRQQTILSHKYSVPFRQTNSHICQRMGTSHPDSKFDNMHFKVVDFESDIKRGCVTVQNHRQTPAVVYSEVIRTTSCFLWRRQPSKRELQRVLLCRGSREKAIWNRQISFYKTKVSVLLLHNHWNWCQQKKTTI